MPGVVTDGIVQGQRSGLSALRLSPVHTCGPGQCAPGTHTGTLTCMTLSLSVTSACPPRWSTPSTPRDHRAHARPGRRPPRRDAPATTCSAAPRPAPARPSPSACPSSPGWPARRAAPTVRARSSSCRRASWPPRYARPSSRSRSPSKLKLATVYGGTPYDRQIKALRQGADIVVATPGRLEDLIDRRAACAPTTSQITVLDEADHLCDLGFYPVVDELLAQTPAERPAAAALGDARR